MNLKEKAEKLVGRYYFQVQTLEQQKQCALIAVENEYNAKIQAYNEMSEFCPDIAGQSVFYAKKEKEEVKKEIENL